MNKQNLVDDTREVINHYENMLGKNDTTVLPAIKLLMQTWSSFIKTKSLTKDDKNIFLEAIKSKNKYICEEACHRLSIASNSSDEIRELFDIVFSDKDWKARLNVITFSLNFKNDYAKKLLEIAINDKSAKVRGKVADVILWRQQKDFLTIIKKRLEIETNKKVRDEINFALEKFDSVIINNDGSKSLRITSSNL